MLSDAQFNLLQQFPIPQSPFVSLRTCALQCILLERLNDLLYVSKFDRLLVNADCKSTFTSLTSGTNCIQIAGRYVQIYGGGMASSTDPHLHLPTYRSRFTRQFLKVTSRI